MGDPSCADTSWMLERRDHRLTPVTWLLRGWEGIFVQIRGCNIFDLTLFSLINSFYILKTYNMWTQIKTLALGLGFFGERLLKNFREKN